jgi:hypothetical protein
MNESQKISLQELAGEYGPIGSLMIGAGSATDSGLEQVKRAYLMARLGLAGKWQGPEAEAALLKRLTDLDAERLENRRLYAPMRQAHGYATAIGEAVPAFAFGRARGVPALQYNMGSAAVNDLAPVSLRDLALKLRGY